jgi:hypothetical protein
MSPLFKAGGVVLVQELRDASGAARPMPGDCAVYKYGGRTLLHRVTGTSAEGVWFSDDAGRLAPHFIPWPEVAGKVLSRNPFAGGTPGLLYCRSRRLAFLLWNSLCGGF